VSKRRVSERGSILKRVDNDHSYLNRSDPLLLDDAGNLKYPLWVQANRPDKIRWRLIVTSPEGKNRGKLVQFYSEAKRLAALFQEKYPDHEVTIVSRQGAYGAPRSKVPDYIIMRMNEEGNTWCPFCRKFRQFLYDPYMEVKRCPVCRIPIGNIYVTKNNFL